MWRAQDHGSRDMVVARSDDLGLSFSKPTKFGTGSWKLEACPMDGGAVVFGGSDLRSVWRRESRIYHADLAGPEREIGRGEQPSMAFGRDGEYVAWLERREGALMVLLPRGKDPIHLDDQANDPVLASGASFRSPVIATWESGPRDAPNIVVARLDSAPPPSGK